MKACSEKYGIQYKELEKILSWKFNSVLYKFKILSNGAIIITVIINDNYIFFQCEWKYFINQYYKYSMNSKTIFLIILIAIFLLAFIDRNSNYLLNLGFM
jgi:hypothetical protein